MIGLFADAAATEALWSWHIWITDKTNDELLAQAETYTMYPAYEQAYGAGTAVMMDRNLGAIFKEDGAYARSFRAPLYQWGRKDPFRGGWWCSMRRAYRIITSTDGVRCKRRVPPASMWAT